MVAGKRSTAQHKPALKKRAVQFVANAVEKSVRGDRFFIANRTPFEVIYRQRIMSVRHYHPLADNSVTMEGEEIPVVTQRHRVPLVLVPPLAATSMIFDLLPDRSVARFFLAHGFDVYLIDWGEVTKDDHDISLETYVLEWLPTALGQIRQHSGQMDLSVFAYCMGGLLTLMYDGVFDDRHLRNLITVASPVDMHRGGVAGHVLAAIHQPARLISATFNVSLLDLPSQALHIPGWLSSLAFKLTDPVGNVMSRVELLANLWDREYVQEHHTMSQWFNKMADFPGETIKGMAVHMAINNRMSKGVMRIGKQEAVFSRIRASLLAFAGDNDTIVSVQAARRIMEIVSSEDRQFYIVPGGHAGVFGGSKAPANAWRISAEWLKPRSR